MTVFFLKWKLYHPERLSLCWDEAFISCFAGYLKDRQHGAATSVRLAVDPAVTQNPAMYYSECNVAETSPGAR